VNSPEGSGAAAGDPPTQSADHAKTLRAVRWAFLGVAVGLLAWALASSWDEVSETLREVGWAAFVYATLAACLALACNTLSWRTILRAVGLAAPLPDTAAVFLVSQSGKYVPGAVWPVLAQAEFAKDHGLARGRALAGSVVAMIVGVATAGAVGALGLLVSAPGAIRDYWWAVAVAAVLLAVLTPPVLRRVIALGLRILRRSEEAPEIGARALGVAAAWSVANWLLLGGQAWLLLRPLADGASLALATGAFALSWLVGFIVVIAPAGIGAREAALVVTLSSVATGPQALAVALLSRFAMTLADALGLLVGLGIRAARRPASR